MIGNTVVHYTHVDYNATAHVQCPLTHLKLSIKCQHHVHVWKSWENNEKFHSWSGKKHIILRSSYLNICISNEKQCFNSNFNGIVQIVFVLGEPKIGTEKGEYDFFGMKWQYYHRHHGNNKRRAIVITCIFKVFFRCSSYFFRRTTFFSSDCWIHRQLLLASQNAERLPLKRETCFLLLFFYMKKLTSINASFSLFLHIYSLHSCIAALCFLNSESIIILSVVSFPYSYII